MDLLGKCGIWGFIIIDESLIEHEKVILPHYIKPDLMKQFLKAHGND